MDVNASSTGMQSCTDKGLQINMDKTKVMVFNTTQTWVTRSKSEFFLERRRYDRYYLMHTLKYSLWKCSLSSEELQLSL